MGLTRGMQLGRYEIVAPLGKGGMGEVYRARDTQLGREVAVKVLPEHLAQDPSARKRFERESRAVAALSHQNILEIHDSGTHGDTAYAVMELLEGETLRERLKGVSIPSRKALEIAVAVADGLAAAHTKGVVHRDLKPENIFLLKDGRVKILDFGLARWTAVSQEEVTEAPTRSQVTQFGSVMGTVPYMSPEQVRGESLDGRSDIFSLGSILYEMLSGKRPFSGNTTNEITASILKDDPVKLHDSSPQLQRIIERCLEKNPDYRFHSAHDLAFALRDILNASGMPASPVGRGRRLNSPAVWIVVIALILIALAAAWKMIGLPQKKPRELSLLKVESLAVLPLKNLSGDDKQEFFADGMTEELTAKLARIASIRVISRTSVMEYKNAQKPLPQIAKELDVDAIVEGSVMYAGNRVRITAQLIHGATDRHLWAESYERDLQDILSLQNEVASAIAREIEVKVAPEESAQLSSASKVNPEAYQAYLRGLNYSEGEVIQKNVQLAVEMFQKAVELDPNFAPGYAQLSRAQVFLYFTFDRTAQRLAKSKEALDRAFELQPGFAEGHLALGYYYYWGFRDYDRALGEWMIAEKTLPNNKTILGGKGAVYRRQGNFEGALAAGKKLLAMNPRHSPTAFNVGITLSAMRRYSEAQRYFDLGISLDPKVENNYLASALNHILWKGDTKSAREILDKIPAKESQGLLINRFAVEILERKYQAALDLYSSPHADPIQQAVNQGLAYRYLGNGELARASFDVARERLENDLQQKPDDYNLHGQLGIAYAGLGRKDEAIREGKRAVALLPVSEDALWGPRAVEYLASIYTFVGEENAAIDQIAYLLSIPNHLNVRLFRMEPRWDSLRNNPRFQKLLSQYD